MARRWRTRPSKLTPTPLEMGCTPLALGDEDTTAEELMELTPDEKARFFMRDLRRRMEPRKRYPHRYEGEDGEEMIGRDWGDIRRHYHTYVLGKGWSEPKYTSVIHGIMKTEAPFSHQILTGYGKRYDERKKLNATLGERPTPLKPL